ncbi:MAG TPA: hypothetical protein VN258_08785 [Mobilitalea sp.]|nr:hypothetical protein [Mobilitalea sp.]
MKIKKFISDFWHLVTYRLIRQKLIVTRVSFSGDGSFIDVRYWISRPDKINPKKSPYLITEQNQRLGLMRLPKFGAVKTKIRKHTNTGILLFYNNNKAVNIGDKVTLYWDGIKVEDITVMFR